MANQRLEVARLIIGRKVGIRIGSLIVYVTVKDAKISYGKPRYLVSPVAGSGEIWTQKIEAVKRDPL